MRMLSRRLLFATLAGTTLGVVVAGGVAFIRHSAIAHQVDLHEMLHDSVPLDAHERELLDAEEQKFSQSRQEIEARLRAANGQLAAAIAKHPAWSSEVEAAVLQVEQAAGDLQRTTLVHVFEMRAGLKPEHRPTYDRVLIEALQRGSQ